MIKWEERFATGDDGVDRQHKLLFDMFNDFEASIHEGRGESYLKSSFPLLEAYAQAHFKFEEDCMERHHCPVSQDNKDSHQTFIVKVQDFKKKFQSGLHEDDLYIQVHAFIERWITSHVIGIDTHLKACIKSKKID